MNLGNILAVFYIAFSHFVTSDVILRLLCVFQMDLGHVGAVFYCGFWTFEQKSIVFYCKNDRAKFCAYYTSSKWIDGQKTL